MNKSSNGCVYFIKYHKINAVKIGMTSHDNPKNRFASINMYSPYGSFIIGYIKTSDYVNVETMLHNKYKSKRLSGEFFDLTVNEVITEIESHKDFYSIMARVELDINPQLNQILLAIENNNYSQSELVSLFELIGYKCGATTLKDMADKECKSYQGILKSKAYYKFKIGNANLCVSGKRNDDMPF